MGLSKMSKPKTYQTSEGEKHNSRVGWIATSVIEEPTLARRWKSQMHIESMRN